MTQIVFHGPAPSSYVRTARMTCVEKGAEHRLEPVELGSASHRELHPFCRVPIMTHGDVRLFESSAIIRYLDASFGGPSLIPGSNADAGVMEQWISATNCYLYDHLIKNYALKYIIPAFRGEAPDPAAIAAGVPAMQDGVKLLDGAYDGRDWIANSFSLADLLLGPILQTISMFPEGKEALGNAKNLAGAYERMRGRKSAEFIDVPQG